MRKGTKSKAAAEGDMTSPMAAAVVNDSVLTALSAGELEAASDAALRPPHGAGPVAGDRTVQDGGRRKSVSAPVGAAAGRGISRDGLSVGVGPLSQRTSVEHSADREWTLSSVLEVLAAERAAFAAERATSAAAMQRMMAYMEELTLQVAGLTAAGKAGIGSGPRHSRRAPRADAPAQPDEVAAESPYFSPHPSLTMSTDVHVRGRGLSGRPFVSHRDELDCGSTVMSVLAGAHSVGEGILGFFNTREARVIRLVCNEFREAVAVVPWADMGTRIRGNVGGWRAQELPARDKGEHLRRVLAAAQYDRRCRFRVL